MTIAEYAIQSAIENPKASIGLWEDERVKNVAISLACKDICQKIRPRLFEDLQLSLAKDVRFLREILRSNLSGWLGAHVLRITAKYDAYESEQEKISSEAVAILLSPRLLPAIKYLQFDSSGMRDGTHFLDTMTLRPQLKRLTSLTHLNLINPKPFPSFSALARLLGSIPSLEDVQLYEVTWKSACKPTDLPDCNASFNSIKRVVANGGRYHNANFKSSWAFAWLVAPPYTGYNYQRRGWRGQNANGATHVPPDIRILTETVRLFLKSLRLKHSSKVAKFVKDERSGTCQTNVRFYQRRIEEIVVYYTGEMRTLYVRLEGYTVQYNWRQSSHIIPPLHPNPPYHICEIIFWQQYNFVWDNNWTISLVEYNSLLKDAPHLQNPRSNDQSTTDGGPPPFWGRWRRYNPFEITEDR